MSLRHGLLGLGLAALVSSVAAKPAPMAPSAPDLWPDHYSLQGYAATAIPLSPRGPDSFAVSYARAYTGGGGLYAHWGAWGLGLEGTGAQFAHQQLDHTSVSLTLGALVLEWAFWTEEGDPEGPFLQLGGGYGSARLDSTYPGSDAWGAPAMKLAGGYRVGLGDLVRVDLVAAMWGLLGDEKRDAVAMGQLALQAGLWW